MIGFTSSAPEARQCRRNLPGPRRQGGEPPHASGKSRPRRAEETESCASKQSSPPSARRQSPLLLANLQSVRQCVRARAQRDIPRRQRALRKGVRSRREQALMATF
jgi:hypothetical protein